MATDLFLITKELRALVERWRAVMNNESTENLRDLERQLVVRLEIELVRQQVIEEK